MSKKNRKNPPRGSRVGSAPAAVADRSVTRGPVEWGAVEVSPLPEHIRRKMVELLGRPADRGR